MHAGVARGVLHLVELSLLFIELHPDLHELPGLITIGQHLGLGGPVRVLHGHVELVGARVATLFFCAMICRFHCSAARCSGIRCCDADLREAASDGDAMGGDITPFAVALLFPSASFGRSTLVITFGDVPLDACAACCCWFWRATSASDWP
jgi:hypothetical protein